MKDILIIHESNFDTCEAGRKEVFKVSVSTKRIKRKDFAILPPRGFSKSIMLALKFSLPGAIQNSLSSNLFQDKK